MASSPILYTDNWIKSDLGLGDPKPMPRALGTCVLLSNYREEFYVRILTVQPNETDIIGIVKSSLDYPNEYNIGDLVKFKWENVLRIHPNSNVQEKRQYAARVLRAHGLKTQANIKSFVARTRRQPIRVRVVKQA